MYAFLPAAPIAPHPWPSDAPLIHQLRGARPCAAPCPVRISRRAARLCLAASAASEMPFSEPRAGVRVPGLSYARIADQVIEAVEQLHVAKSSTASSSTSSDGDSDGGTLRVTVDFPPLRSETRAGTLVSRFENHLTFLDELSDRLCGASRQRVGPDVEIRDNINPQGGGEYLTDDEVMVGVVVRGAATLPGAPTVTMLINAGVDASTLRQIQRLEAGDRNEVVLLLNCGLERVSWFAKMGVRDYLDAFVPAYYLATVAAGGWLLKRGAGPWTVFAQLPDGVTAVARSEERPRVMEVEGQIRVAVAQSR